MANNTVSDVNVRVSADVAQFRAAMQGASATMKQLRAEVASATRDFRGGKISGEDYAVALSHAREQAALLRNEQRMLAPASLGAARGIGTVRSTLASLAAMSLGVKGTFGTLTSALLFMSVGNLTAIGVIAGLMAVAKGYELITSKSKEAREGIERTAQGLADAWVKGSQRQVISQQLGMFKAQRDQLRAPAAPGVRRMLATWWRQITGETEEQSEVEQLRTLNRAIAQLGKQLSDLDAPAREAAQALSVATSGIDEARRAALQAVDDFNRFNPPGQVIFPTDQGPMNRGDALQRAHAMEQRLRQQGEEMRDRLTQPWKDQQAAQEMSEVGELWARSILTSMVRAFRDGNVGKAFANILGTLLEQIIVGAIMNGIRGAAGGGGFFGWLGKLLSFDTGGVVPGRSGQAQLAVVHGGETVMPTRGGSGVFQVAVPQLTGPALITNAEWQRIWRDTAREATRQGFRMAVI